jgi:uncharacterized protein YndB with AHSA1/START domain
VITENQILDTTGREIVISRLLNAPRELVFSLWTDPKHLIYWWGPNGFTNTFHEIEVKTGGVWRFMMHGPDGVDYPNLIHFDEVTKPERLVYRHGSDEDPEQFHVTVTFEEQGAKTQLTMRSVFRTAAERDFVVEKFKAVEGGNQTISRLEDRLATTIAAHEFVVSRVFKASRELIFKAFTETQHLDQWWGPKGFTMVVSKMDLRPGGSYHYAMRSPDGKEMWGKFVYREVVKPERIVFVNFFSNKAGEVTGNPYSPNWPLEVLNIMTLTEKNGETTLTLRGYPINASEAGLKAFREGHASMNQGFGGTFDQLQEYLGKMG